MTVRLCQSVRLVTFRQRENLPELEYEQLGVPLYADHVWEWFWEIEQTRNAETQYQPLSFTEIAAWSQLTGEVLNPWEVRAIKFMDAARRGTLVPSEKPKVQMTAEIFDSLFGA